MSRPYTRPGVVEGYIEVPMDDPFAWYESLLARGNPMLANFKPLEPQFGGILWLHPMCRCAPPATPKGGS